MAHASDKAGQKLDMLLAHRRQLTELRSIEQQRLLSALTESERQESATHFAQLSRLLTETDDELTQFLQTSLRPHERRGWCRKAFHE